MTRTYLLAFCAAAALAIGVQAVQAQPNSDNGSPVTVRISDLNLGSADGAKAMLARIESASERVCGSAPSIFDLDASSAYNTCVKETTANAVRSLNAPMVTVAAGGSITFEQASAH